MTAKLADSLTPRHPRTENVSVSWGAMQTIFSTLALANRMCVCVVGCNANHFRPRHWRSGSVSVSWGAKQTIFLTGAMQTIFDIFPANRIGPGEESRDHHHGQRGARQQASQRRRSLGTAELG